MALCNLAFSSEDKLPELELLILWAAALTACQLPDSMACSNSDFSVLWLLCDATDMDVEPLGLALARASSLADFCTARRALLAI